MVNELAISADLLRRFDVAGPRYTSYPTADRFVDAFTASHYQQALVQRVSGSVSGGDLGALPPLSLYIHLPFCESVCYFCACNKVITRHHERAAEYLQALYVEMDLHLAQLGPGSTLAQLHLGGGSPTFLSDAELAELVQALRQRFHLAADMEMAIEVDPRTVTRARLQHLRALGFNRLSFGVQDFDPAVQQAVHRVQSLAMVTELMGAARELGFESTNVDLIYGLPRQTPASFARTVAQVAALRPDRIALYGYAHLPQRFKPQRRIANAELPMAGDKLSMLSNAISGFLGEGYSYIGMDHFALPTDSLAVAKRQGRLHRNFQGYSTQPDCDLIGLGVSAIGRVGTTYSQNVKTLDAYYDNLRRGQLPIDRGLALTHDDIVRRAVIMALMCQGRVEFESVERAYLIDMHRYFEPELLRLRELAAQGLLVFEPAALRLTEIGWYFVRAVAMVFDRYLLADPHRERFSRII